MAEAGTISTVGAVGEGPGPATDPGGAADPAGAAGLFGPGSVTWRLHSDPVAGVAGLRALLLQTLDPRSMAGVDQHSLFRVDPWGRLARTALYVSTTTFGSTQDAQDAGARVRDVHRRVKGVDPVTGEPYDASASDQLLWVHCCLVDSFASTVRRAGTGVGDRDVDRYVGEQVAAAQLVGVPAAQVPTTGAELAEYFAGQRPRLRSSPISRAAVAHLLAPPMPVPVALGTPARPAWAALAGLAMALLPAWARRMHAVPSLLDVPAATDAAATASLRALRVGLVGAQRLAPALREPPALVAARLRIDDAAARSARRARSLL